MEDPEQRSGDSGDPGDPGGSEDSAWEEIVANYGERPTLDDEPEPLTKLFDDRLIRPAEEPDWFVAEPIDLDGEERYVPPPPPPIELGSPARTLAWIGVGASPVVAVLLIALRSIVGLALPSWLWAVLVVAFLGGFGYLIATMPKDRDDPWDDGARV